MTPCLKTVRIFQNVQEYVCDDLADDEADASKIKKATVGRACAQCALSRPTQATQRYTNKFLINHVSLWSTFK